MVTASNKEWFDDISHRQQQYNDIYLRTKEEVVGGRRCICSPYHARSSHDCTAVRPAIWLSRGQEQPKGHKGENVRKMEP